MKENKQIIINGVNVLKCKDFDSGECINPAETVSVCEALPFCLFKQLARKTQECETKTLEFEGIKNQLDRLKAENEQAEQKLKRIRDIAEQMCNECIYDDFECKDCNLKEGCTYFNKGKILQIIDEVE